MSEKKENLAKACAENSVSSGPCGKKLLHTIEQWSQDENCGEDQQLVTAVPLINGQTRPLNDSGGMGINKTLISKNNNLVEQESNLGCSVDKCSYYKTFTLKVNNNIYSEQLNQIANKDGMEEYFLLNAKTEDTLHMNSGISASAIKQPDHPNGNSTFCSQINALNRDYDEEDDDSIGCIYTYKGDSYESNLSHMFDTCHSCGLPTIARMVSPPRPESNALSQPAPQNNIYSPEMDFLEMDFDPGSNGDGPDSECEDNNTLSIDPSQGELRSTLVATNAVEENSVSPYICHQCEQSAMKDKKLNNLPENDQKSASAEQNAPVSFSEMQNNELKENAHTELLVDTTNQNVEPENEGIFPDNENNLDVHVTSSDESGDADDEGDDSVSERFLKHVARRSSSSFFYPNENLAVHQHSVQSAEENAGKNSYGSSTKDPSSIGKAASGNTIVEPDKEATARTDNDLGSVSAPEVSPTKEFSALEKLTRSLSFHNQLSSPKYHNVCSDVQDPTNCTHFQRFDISSDSDPCHCENQQNSGMSSLKELSNIEVCSDRLHQRLLSVFNIGSEPSDEWSGKSNEQKPTNMPENCLSQFSLVNIPNDMGGKSTGNLQNTIDANRSLSNDLPLKIIDSKSENPCKDTNLDDAIDQVFCEPTTQMEKVMIWTEPQASYRQITQLGTSACGPTAVMNVLLALDHAVPVSSVTNSIKARLRAEKSPLVEYLFSRGNAGTTHEDLIRGVQELSRSAITSRFFHMYPKRSFQLSRWLGYWIKKGGVPVATLNLQVAVDPRRQLPDAWHHQMVFGVGPRGVYLTNPLDCESDSLLSEQLCSDSVLLVRRCDIVQRWNKKDQLIKLSLHSDPRWSEMNVLGQVVGVLKEHNSPETPQGRRHLTSHVAIPASYQSGITIFMRSDNPSCEDLLNANELPLLSEDH